MRQEEEAHGEGKGEVAHEVAHGACMPTLPKSSTPSPSPLRKLSER